MRAALTLAVRSLITGVLSGVVALALAWSGGVSQPWQLSAVVASGAALVSWLVSARGERELEPGAAPGAKYMTSKALTSETLRVEVVSDNGNSTSIINLPARASQLVALARGVQYGEPFTVARWCGSRKPFSRHQFELLRSAMLSRGLLVWRDENERALGVEFTRAGKSVMRYFSTHPPEREERL